MHHQAWLIFVFLIEVRFNYVGLELLTSGDPPASISLSAAITSVSHRAQPCLSFFVHNVCSSKKLLPNDCVI